MPTSDSSSSNIKTKSRTLLFLLLAVCGISLPSLSGSLVFPFSALPMQSILLYGFALSFVFLSLSVFLRIRNHSEEYFLIFFAFFTASIGISIDLLLNIPSETITGLVSDMLLSTTIIVGIIFLLTRVSGTSLRSIFASKGNLKLGVTAGVAGFLFFAVTAIPAAEYLFQGQNLTLNRVLALLPWVLPTVFLNGVREEFLYRGLFLKKFEPKLGLKTSNLLQAIIFSLSHSVAGVGLNAYTPFISVLVVFTLSLGLIWGYIMQRTNSVIGSVLFHAGSDIPVFLGIFSNLF